MLSRWRYNFVKNNPFLLLKLQSCAALRGISLPTECPSKSPGNQQPCERTCLTPQIVLGTLQNCHSDIIALSLFLWYARQPDYFHGKPTFRHMANVVSNLTQRFGTVKGIVEELRAVGCLIKAQTFLLLMRIYWHGEMYDMVLEAFDEMSKHGYVPNTYARNIVMDVLFKVKRVDVALQVLNGTQVPNFLSFNIAICNLCRLNEIDNVKRVLRWMLVKRFYLNPETYLLVLNCFCKSSKLTEALQLLGVMIISGTPLSMNGWSILIDCYCKTGQIEVASFLLEKMFQIGLFPNIVACTSVIKGFLESLMPDKAFKILGTLESKGCFPDLVLCNVLIDCLSKMGWYKIAFHVFSSMGELKLAPDVYTFSSLMSAICLSKQYFLLPLLIRNLTVQPDIVVCNCFLNYFCKGGYPAGAVEFYNDMIDRGLQPDNYSFAGLLSAICRLGMIHEAVNVYKGIVLSNSNVDAHIHTIMITELINSGCFHRAIRLFRKAAVEKFSLDVVSYNVVIDGLMRSGLTGEAYSLFSQMKSMGLVPNMLSYNLILAGFCKGRDIDMVLQVIQEMVHKKMGLDNKTYNMLKKFLYGSRNYHLVLNLLTELRNLELLPKDAHALLNDGYDVGAFTSSSCVDDPQNVVDLLSRDEDIPVALASAG